MLCPTPLVRVVKANANGEAHNMVFKIRHVALLASTAMLAACGGSDADTVELPYGTAQQLMANEVQPTADIYWGAVKFESILNDDGTVTERDIRPETDEDWATVEASAVHMGELGAVMLTPAYADGRGDDWSDFAQGLIDVSARAAQAAADHDPDAVFEVGGTMYNVCRACHQMYPPEELPEGMTVEDVQRPNNDETLEEYVAGDQT